MRILTQHRRTKGLVAGVIAGASSLALLGVSASPALATYNAQVQGGVLRIVGNADSDKLALIGDPGNNRVLVDVGEDGTTDFSFDGATFSSIDVEAGGGDDTVDVANGMAGFGHLTVNGGDGNDTLRGGDGNDTINGGSGNDAIDGGIGADVLLGGTGNDTIAWNPGEGSDTVEGGGGADALDFHGSNAAEKIDVSANGSRVRLFRDVANITMDLNAIETLNVNTLGSADTVTVGNLTGTGLTAANVDLSSFGAGDGSPDNVIVTGTDGPDHATVGAAGGNIQVSGLGELVQVSGSESQDQVSVDTLGGDDSISSGVTTPGPAKVAIDGGEGTDTSKYSGTAAADNIGIANDGTAVATFAAGGNGVQDTTNVESLVVNGRQGDDTITGQNGISQLTHLTVNGGSGNDTLGGGDGDDAINGGSGNDTLDGNRGSDVLLGGTGNDTIVWDPGDGSDTAEGGGGSDAMDFHGSNAAEKIDVSANGSRVRLFRDVAAITMDLGTIETLNVNTLGSADTVTVNNLTGTALTAANVDLSSFGAGDGSPDNVIVTGTDGPDHATVGAAGGNVQVSGLGELVQVSGAESQDQVSVDTLGGDDSISSGVTTPGPEKVAIDGGEGTDTSTYSGTAAADNIGIANDGTAVATFAAGGNGVQDTTNVESLVVNGLSGDDTIVGQNGIAMLMTHLTINGGDGNDTLGGGDGDDAINGGSGNDTLDGNRGSDVLLGGTGNDTIVWDPGDGSDTADGGGGSDAMDFHGSNAAENIDVSANGSRVRLHRDVANITMDLNAIETLNVNTLGSADTVTVGNLAGTGLTAANVDLSSLGAGDGSPDTVIANGSNGADLVNVTRSGSQVLVAGLHPALSITGSEPANDTLDVNTLDGKDQVTVAPDVSQLIAPVVNLGADQ